MDSEKLAEYVIRIDERLASVSSDVKDIKTNFKETSEDVIVLRTEMTNHLSHHEDFEKTLPVFDQRKVIGYTGVLAAIIVATIEILFMTIGR